MVLSKINVRMSRAGFNYSFISFRHCSNQLHIAYRATVLQSLSASIQKKKGVKLVSYAVMAKSV